MQRLWCIHFIHAPAPHIVCMHRNGILNVIDACIKKGITKSIAYFCASCVCVSATERERERERECV